MLNSFWNGLGESDLRSRAARPHGEIGPIAAEATDQSAEIDKIFWETKAAA